MHFVVSFLFIATAHLYAIDRWKTLFISAKGMLPLFALDRPKEKEKERKKKVEVKWGLREGPSF